MSNPNNLGLFAANLTVNSGNVVVPIANGGTGVTTSTGSGNVVLSSSPVLTTPNIGTPSFGNLTSMTGLPLTTGVTGILPIANGGTGATTSTGTGNVVLSVSPQLTSPQLGTPASGNLVNTVGLPLTTGVTGILPIANGGTGATTATGTGALVLQTSPSLTTPNLGTPSSAILTNATGLPLTSGVTGILSVANGGTGAVSLTGYVYGNGTGTMTASTTVPVTSIGSLGTGIAAALQNNIGSTGAPITFNGALGTPSAGTLTNATGLPLSTGVTGILPVASGGTGTTTSTGTGSVVLSTSPTLVTPALGTPSSAVLTNATGLPLSTGVTGTLSIANGGTGSTTAAAAREALNVSFKMLLNVKDYGATGNGSTDDTTAIQNALNAIATGGGLFFPAGTYVLSSQLTCTLSPSGSAVSIMLAGAGADVTNLVWAAGGGLKINYADIFHGAHIRDMSFLTGTTNTGSAILLNQTASSTPNGGNSAITSIDNVTIRGSDGYSGTNYWANGVNIANVSNVNMLNCSISGSNTSGIGHGVGVNIIGTSTNDAVQFDLTSCVINYCYQGIFYNNYVEGVSVVALNSIGCQYGIMSNGYESNLLQLSVVNSQINANLTGIYTQSVINVFLVSNNLFIVPVGATGNPSIGINCDAAGLFSICNNVFIPRGSSVNNYGVQISANATYPGIISNNIFHTITLGIALLGGAKNINCKNNEFFSCNTNFVNYGSGGIISDYFLSYTPTISDSAIKAMTYTINKANYKLDYDRVYLEVDVTINTIAPDAGSVVVTLPSGLTLLNVDVMVGIEFAVSGKTVTASGPAGAYYFILRFYDGSNTSLAGHRFILNGSYEITPI